MKFVVNKEKQPLSFAFEGKTYRFAVTDEIYKIEEPLFNHLREIVPLAFDFELKPTKNDAVIEPEIVDTTAIFKGGQFGQQSRKIGEPPANDPTSEGLVGDGWYGDGLQDDSV